MPGAHGVGCGCKAEEEFVAAEFLYNYIDIEGVNGLNLQEEGSAKRTIKPYSDRLDDSTSCKSEEGDPEMIIYIPFVSPCKVSSLVIIGGADGRSPSLVKIFANRDDLDFTNIRDCECIQEIQLTQDFHGAVEYPLKVTRLQNAVSISLYFTQNFGGDCTEIFYIGLRGAGSNYKRKAVQTVYEAQPNLTDHKQRGEEFAPPSLL